MAGPQTVWGIDVGRSTLKALKLRIAADKSVEVVAADCIEHASIMNQKDAATDALWSAALEKFLSRNDISNDKVVVSIAGKPTLARFSKLPPVEKKKIPDIVRYEADQQIPFDMDEVVWDYQIFQEADSPEVEVGIFAVKRDLMRDHLAHFESAGIEPLAVQSAPLALYNGMRYDGAIANGAVVLVDIGTENTDLLVATAESLWSRNINVGGNNFTESLVKSFKLSFSKAEALKRTAATSKYARQIFQAMRPVFADLVQELQRSIGYYTASHRDVELTKVIGLGSAFKLPGLQKYVQQNLQTDVIRLERFEKISIPDSRDGEPNEAGNFAVAYGLALQGLGQAKVTSNLLPPEIARQVVWRKKRPFFAAAAACLVLASGVILFRGMTDKRTLESSKGDGSVHVASVDDADRNIVSPPAAPPLQYGKLIHESAQVFSREFNELSSQGNEELDKIDQIAKLLENRALWLRLLHVVHDSLPQREGPFGAAQTAEEYKAVVASAASPRNTRDVITIDSFDSEFSSKIDEVAIEDDWSANTDLIKKEGEQERPGFVLTLQCSTPNKGTGVFVTSTFVKALREKGRVPKQGFYINRIGVTSGDSGRGAGDRRAASRGRGSRRTDDQSQPTQPTSSAKVDPLTNESIAEDWSFRVTVEVILADLPEPEPTNDQSGGQ